MKKALSIITAVLMISMLFTGCKKPESSKNGDAVIPGCYYIYE